MRKFKSITRIVRINQIDGFKIYCAFNNGEHRIIDFKKFFRTRNFNRDEVRKRIMDPKIFSSVQVIENTLAWPDVNEVIELKSGKTFEVIFDIDPLVLYENSVPDVKRNERYKIGQLIKSEREKAGITQSELAHKSGTTRNYISRIENNRSDIELRTLRKIVELGFGKNLELAIK